jgi:hypothetical protein
MIVIYLTPGISAGYDRYHFYRCRRSLDHIAWGSNLVIIKQIDIKHAASLHNNALSLLNGCDK